MHQRRNHTLGVGFKGRNNQRSTPGLGWPFFFRPQLINQHQLLQMAAAMDGGLVGPFPLGLGVFSPTGG